MRRIPLHRQFMRGQTHPAPNSGQNSKVRRALPRMLPSSQLTRTPSSLPPVNRSDQEADFLDEQHSAVDEKQRQRRSN